MAFLVALQERAVGMGTEMPAGGCGGANLRLHSGASVVHRTWSAKVRESSDLQETGSAVVAVVALRRLTRVEKAPSAGGKKRRKGKGRRAVEEEDEWTEEDGLASRGRAYSYDSE